MGYVTHCKEDSYIFAGGEGYKSSKKKNWIMFLQKKGKEITEIKKNIESRNLFLRFAVIADCNLRCLFQN